MWLEGLEQIENLAKWSLDCDLHKREDNKMSIVDKINVKSGTEDEIKEEKVSDSNLHNLESVKKMYAPDESHYDGSIQPLEFMQANMNKDEFIGFLKGNVIKYVSRASKKGSSHDDLLKAKRYLEWLILTNANQIINPRQPYEDAIKEVTLEGK